MSAHTPSAIVGDFSLLDLLREAAERSIQVRYLVDEIPSMQTPTMSGTLRAEEVQPGLLMSAYDLTHIADGELAVEIDQSLLCGILLDGESLPMTIDGHGIVAHKTNHVEIIGFGDTVRCHRPWRAGSHARTFGISLRPHFLERFSRSLTSDDLAPLQELMAPGFRRITLPWRPALVDIANSVVSHPYSGQLATLFHESHALRFLLEIVLSLKEQQRASKRVGRIRYERATHAREILDRSLSDPPKSLDLARQVGVNLTTLQADFKQSFGTTIFGYVRVQRLEMARILILEHGTRIAEAGARVGFTNPAAFTAAYRKHFGRPPTADQRS
ncbi:MAG: helix-turn-helix transcriptional regulator [Rhizobiaceae bacterium]